MDIKITVKRKLPICGDVAIVCNNSDYTVIWELDDEWSGYDTKTMRTAYQDGTYTDTVFTGDTVALPVVTVPGTVKIGLYAGDIRTSRPAPIVALDSITSDGGAPAAPGEDVYNQIMELIKGMGGASEEDIAKAVAKYLTEHPLEEKDPTVPAWAKEKEKPTYTADEVGAATIANVNTALQSAWDEVVTPALNTKQDKGDYLTADDLQDATNAALAQAKASGEFDGADGAPGKDGTVGKDGTDGITPTIGDNGNWYLGDEDTGKPSRGADAVSGTATAVLTADGWADKSQTVSVSGVAADSTVIVSPAPASVPAYAAAQVYCSAQGDGTLTFTCDTLPTAELAVNVVILR